MFWLGLAVALIAGLLSVDLPRRWIQRRWPWIKPYVDPLVIFLLVAGLGVAAYEHAADFAEHQRLDALASQRDLSEETKRRLLEGLRAFPNKYEVLIGFNLGDVEAQTLAEELSEVFQGAGWLPPNQQTGTISPPLDGIRIHASRQPPAELVEALRPLFDQFRDDPTPFIDSGVPTGVTEIVIGTKSQ